MDTNMSEFARSTKRRISRVSTTPRALNAGMNQEFVDTRRRLNDISAAIKRLSKSVESTRQTWTTVAREQRDFSHSLASSFPTSGAVHQQAVEVEKHLRNIQEDIIIKDTSEAPHQQILRVLDKYLDILKSIQQQYKEVEVAYTEKIRYQRKVDRLEKKNNTGRKHSDKLVRNVEKLNDAQRELDSKLEAILERMRNAFQKHEAVLQCAHHAFWMANNTHMEAIEKATKDIRSESVAIHELLLGLDLTEDKQLTPIPRPNMIESQEGASQPQINNASDDRPVAAITNGSVQTITPSPSSKSSSSIQNAPTPNSNTTEIVDEVSDSKVSSDTSDSEDEVIKKIDSVTPDNMKPNVPSSQPNATLHTTQNQPVVV